MNAVDRTDVHARGILGADAGLADDIRHSYSSILVLRAIRRARADALFTPPHPRLGRYEVCATDEPLDGRLERRRADRGARGARRLRRGRPYDRAALARLYGGTRGPAWRAAGPDAATAFESITLTVAVPRRDAHPPACPARWRSASSLERSTADAMIRRTGMTAGAWPHDSRACCALALSAPPGRRARRRCRPSRLCSPTAA